MMEVPKIQLSVTESELMQDTEIILTKNRVLQKIKNLLENLQLQQTAWVTGHLEASAWFRNPPKISRGENYGGLPYLVLDYPRVHQDQNLFFIRSMFWWGNFFSSTLHLSGTYKEIFGEQINQGWPLLHQHYVGINQDPWQHHFETINYRKIGELSPGELQEHFRRYDHLKIAISWPLKEWSEAGQNLFENWKLYVNICGLIT